MIKDKNPHHEIFSYEELERMYVSYMKRTYEGKTIKYGTHLESFEEFKEKMLNTEWITLNI